MEHLVVLLEVLMVLIQRVVEMIIVGTEGVALVDAWEIVVEQQMWWRD